MKRLLPESVREIFGLALNAIAIAVAIALLIFAIASGGTWTQVLILCGFCVLNGIALWMRIAERKKQKQEEKA